MSSLPQRLRTRRGLIPIYFAIFADGHNRQLPKITGGPFHYNFFAGELVKKAVKMTDKPLHQAVIAPWMMYLLYPLDRVVELSRLLAMGWAPRTNIEAGLTSTYRW